MAPFSIPAPCIIPLCTPVFGRPRSINTNTKIELLCDTYLKHEIFYTLDGTRPQPYVGIVQGSKTYKYSSPFCLPFGKITVKAVAVNPNIHSMSSNVITKCFDVLLVKASPNSKRKKGPSKRSNHTGINNEKYPVHSLDEQQDTLELISGDEEKKDWIVKQGVNSENEHITKLILSETDENIDENNLEKGHELHSDILSVESGNEKSEDDDLILEALQDIEDTFASGDKKYTSGSSDLDFLTDLHENSTHFEEENIENEKPSLQQSVGHPSSEPPICCIKCDMTVQRCSACQKMNSLISKYCIQCGEQLAQICSYCNEQNSSIASYCQYCGKKLDSESEDCDGMLNLKIAQSDYSIMVRPELKHAGIQKMPLMINKHTQTCQIAGSRKEIKKDLIKYDVKLPTHSPGRGYWHQQLDYICNHLKSHAYNNLDFRKTISEPCLSSFQSASVTKDEKSVIVTIIFTPLVIEKSDPTQI